MSGPSSPIDRPQFTTTIAIVLSFSVAIMVVGQSSLFTILPPLGRKIGLSDAQVGLIMSIHGAFMLFAGPWWGAFSETAGRRRVIFIGAVLYTASTLIFGLIIDAGLRLAITSNAVLWLMIGCRSIFAVGAGAVTTASMALAADLSARENRLKAMSLLATAVSTGAIAGPAVSALFAGFGLAAPFYIIAGCGFIALCASQLLLPAIRPQMHVAPIRFRDLLRGRVLLIAAGSLCFMWGNYGIYAIVGFHIQDRFMLEPIAGARLMGLALMGASLASILMQSFVVRRLKARTAVFALIGIPITIVSFAVVWSADVPWLFVAAITLNGFGQSFVNPAISTALSLSVGASGQGRLAGLSTSTQACAFLFGPASSAAMYGYWHALPFLFGTVLISVSLALLLLVRQPAPIDET
ncbi:MAG: MFS transporter [Rhodospirillaceae bacterium]|nr:MFS transporter [Rhodospirillaceae bacterium]